MVRKLNIIFVILVIFQIVLAQEAKKCYQCDSSKDPNCINDLSKIQSTECQESDNYKYCKTSVDEKGILIRSCSTTECTSSSCKSSTKDNGNNHNVCQTCDSSTDPNCAQSEKALPSFNKICEAEDTKCLINIKDKNTERRCASADDIKSCTNTDTCKTCSGVNCNSGIFPTNRLYCFQCSGSNCDNLNANNENIKSSPCQFYDSKDKCYTIGTSSSDMVRGCVSDSADKGNKCSSTETNELCLRCDRANCNNENFMREQSLKCIQCTSSASETKCMWGMNSDEAKNCKNKIEYNKEEMCYTQVKDGVVHRGCYYDRENDLGKCEDNCETCKIADKDGCNNKDKANFTCIICRSDVNLKCYDDADKIPGTECREPVQYEETACFHGKWNGVVIRGCLVDADERVQATCKDAGNNQCIFCDKKDCNTEKTSSAAHLNGFGTIFLIGVIFLMQKF